MSGDQYVWKSPVTGSWDVASNWNDVTRRANPASVPPGSADTVAISAPGSYIVSLATAVTIRSLVESDAGATLAMAGSVVTVSQNLTVHGAFNINADSGDGGSSLTVGGALANSGTVTIGSAASISAPTVTLGNVANAGTIHLVDGQFVSATGASARATVTIRNLSGGIFDVDGDAGIEKDGNGTSLFINAGTMAKTVGSGISHVAVNFTDTGTISVADGNLRFDGARNSFAGTYIGPGMIDYGYGSTATVSTVNMIGGACSTNFGTVNERGVVTLADGSTITNTADATWKFTGNAGLALAASGGSPTFTNWGRLAKTGGSGTTAIGIDVVDVGNVVVGSGTLAFDGASTSLAGTISGAGRLLIGGGSTSLGPLNVTVATLDIGGGAATLANDLTYAGKFLFGSAAELDLNGHALTLTGATSFAGGDIDGTAGLTDALVVRGASENLSSLDFSSWTPGSDTVTIDGTARADNLTGSSQNDTIDGGAGNDRLTSGSGDDMLTGGAGADTFIFHAGFGHDTVADFTATGAARDTIQIDHALIAGFKGLLQHAAQIGADTVITYDGNNTITLDNVQLASLTASNFRFT